MPIIIVVDWMAFSYLPFRSPIYVMSRRKTHTGLICRKVQHFLLKSASTVSDSNRVKVTFLPEGVSIMADPGESLYKVAEEAGIELLFSCCVGDCGSCEVQVLSQEANKHRKLFIRPCIAKVPANKSELVLHTVGSDIPPW